MASVEGCFFDGEEGASTKSALVSVNWALRPDVTQREEVRTPARRCIVRRRWVVAVEVRRR